MHTPHTRLGRFVPRNDFQTMNVNVTYICTYNIQLRDLLDYTLIILLCISVANCQNNISITIVLFRYERLEISVPPFTPSILASRGCPAHFYSVDFSLKRTDFDKYVNRNIRNSDIFQQIGSKFCPEHVFDRMGSLWLTFSWFPSFCSIKICL